MFPRLQVPPSTREMVDVFGGYDHNLRISENAFFDMKNMTSDYYPVLAPRARRGLHAKPASPQGMIAKDVLCYVDGSAFVVGEDRVEMGLSVQTKDCPKRLVGMGAYVIVMPDKMYINTMDLTDFGNIEASFSTDGDVTFTLCALDGEAYGNASVSANSPENPSDQDLWIDTSAQPHALKRYSEASGMWVSIATTYVKISAADIGKKFSEHDAVTISGITAESVKSLNGTMVIYGRGDDYIIVVGVLDTTVTQKGITAERKMPEMDFIIESNNRLWGCRYGIADNGEMVNEIYASKLGDFRNWNCFMGISTDSYAASCGTDGAFTGAIAHLGYPLFIKENFFHKVHGSYPATYQIQTIACRGVQKGCHESLAIVNEVLYYKSRNGICAYDGSLPVEVSHALGSETYSDAVGGSHGNKYYVSMKNGRNEWNMFVYDTQKGVWHREDNLHASAFCSCMGELYCIDAVDRNIITVHGSGDIGEFEVDWMMQTGEIGLSLPNMKYITRLDLRMSVENGTVIDIYVQYDMSEEWLHVCNIRGTALRTLSIPIRPRRCDHMKIRIEGKGSARIYSMTKTIEQGG